MQEACGSALSSDLWGEHRSRRGVELFSTDCSLSLSAQTEDRLNDIKLDICRNRLSWVYDHYLPQLFKNNILVHSTFCAHTVLSQLVIGSVLCNMLMYVLFFVSQTRKMHLLLSLLFFIGKLGQTVYIHAVQELLSINQAVIERCMAIMVINLSCVTAHDKQWPRDMSSSGRPRFKEDTDNILVVTAASVTSSSISRTSLNKICEIGLHHSEAAPTFYPPARGCLYCSPVLFYPLAPCCLFVLFQQKPLKAKETFETFSSFLRETTCRTMTNALC